MILVSVNFDLIGADKQILGVRTMAQEHRVRAPQIPCCNMLQFPEAFIVKRKAKKTMNQDKLNTLETLGRRITVRWRKSLLQAPDNV